MLPSLGHVAFQKLRQAVDDFRMLGLQVTSLTEVRFEVEELDRRVPFASGRPGRGVLQPPESGQSANFQGPWRIAKRAVDRVVDRGLAHRPLGRSQGGRARVPGCPHPHRPATWSQPAPRRVASKSVKQIVSS